jgi:hypothetical protein
MGLRRRQAVRGLEEHSLQRGRSPLHTRAADAVSGQCWRLTRTMPGVPASWDCQIGLARLPATVLGAGQDRGHGRFKIMK